MRGRKVAFVLSGGGSRGALQVGALRALLERGIYPQILVGSSVGAVNAAYLAGQVSLARVDALAEAWRAGATERVYPGGKMMAVRRILSGADSLFPNEVFRQELEAGLPPDCRHFDQLTDVRLYIVATDLEQGTMHVFGDTADVPVIDALMATTALPILHPPWVINGVAYADGALVAPLPVRVAVERGATEIYALHVFDGPHRNLPGNALIRVANQAIAVLIQNQWQHELQEVLNLRRVRLHHIQLIVPQPIALWDFSHTEMLIEAGYEMAQAYLASEVPVQSRLDVRLRKWVRRVVRGARSWRPALVAPWHIVRYRAEA